MSSDSEALECCTERKGDTATVVSPRIPFVSGAPVPFHEVYWTGKEHIYFMEAIASGKISGNGPFTAKCESQLEQLLGVKKALLTTSCTHALEMMALLLNIGPDDEVIVPSFTFCSTALAFSRHGARIVFVDSRKDTFNIDEQLIEQAITPRTKAIVAVHYAGVACEMDEIVRIASKHGVHVLEDAAHAFLGRYKGRPLGSIGTFGALSFHETKNVTCGEGGALLINDAAYRDRAFVVRSCGNDRHRYLKGISPSYSWIDTGSSYKPADLLVSMLLAQLESARNITVRRGFIWHIYRDALKDWAEAEGVELPFVPRGCVSAYHIFALLMPTPQAAKGLAALLKDASLASAAHYQPLHLSAEGIRVQYDSLAHCPNAVLISQCILRLPIFTGLSMADQNRIIDTILTFNHVVPT